MRSLILIGYWRSRNEPLWPDPAWFVDERWEQSTREMVARHLRGGVTIAVAPGLGWCRFRCGIDTLGASLVSDGQFLWPEGLSHYVEQHSVRLPEQFVEHIRSGIRMEIGPEDSLAIESAWWRTQHGSGIGDTFLTPGRGGRLLAVVLAPPTADTQRFLRHLGAEIQHIGSDIAFGPLSQPLVLLRRCDYTAYLGLRERARDVGLLLIFEEPTDGGE
jgi:hypothetical protein